MQEDNKIIIDREIRRRNILSLMNQDVYISRYDLPGAAKTKRFNLVDRVKSGPISEGSPKNDKSIDEFKIDRSKNARVENNKDKNVILGPKESPEKNRTKKYRFQCNSFFQ